MWPYLIIFQTLLHIESSKRTQTKMRTLLLTLVSMPLTNTWNQELKTMKDADISSSVPIIGLHAPSTHMQP